MIVTAALKCTQTRLVPAEFQRDLIAGRLSVVEKAKKKKQNQDLQNVRRGCFHF